MERCFHSVCKCLFLFKLAVVSQYPNQYFCCGDVGALFSNHQFPSVQSILEGERGLSTKVHLCLFHVHISETE